MNLSDIARAAGLAHGYLPTIPNAAVRNSPIHGLGLFNTHPLNSGDVLTRLDGQRIVVAYAPGVLFTLEWNALTKTELLVRPIRTSYGYINHSRMPNLAIDDRTQEIRALRRIDAGEELLLDYLDQPLPEAYLNHPNAEYLRR